MTNNFDADMHMLSRKEIRAALTLIFKHEKDKLKVLQSIVSSYLFIHS